MIRINLIKVKFNSFDEFEAELNQNLQHCEATCDGVMWDRGIDEYIHPCNSFSDFNWDIHDHSEHWKEDDHWEHWEDNDHWEHEDHHWNDDHDDDHWEHWEDNDHWEHEDHHWDDDHDSNQNFHFAGADLGYKPSKKRQ